MTSSEAENPRCRGCGIKDRSLVESSGYCRSCLQKFVANADEESLFEILIQTPKSDRQVVLRKVCGDHESFFQHMLGLLKAYESTGGLIGERELPETRLESLEKTSTRIGKFKLLQKIGEGGMGTVYLAEQDEPVRRRVALKLIREGLGRKQTIARFEAERQALAMMEHQNIAQMYDAGTTDSGQPYFVMELVKGYPITEYCDEQRLSVRQRFELMIPVCHAVQHAHQKGIIHRDLKPTNILVAEYDGIPIPKIIDFGVAKALDRNLTDKTMFTQYGQIVGTLEYMSPEQARLNQLDVDTRSDVYSLGVLLYELLTGLTPFDKARMQSAAIDELLRLIREVDPPRPSIRVGSSDTAPAIASKRKLEPTKFKRMFAGEVDLIVMKAMQKDRRDRYQSASELADDIKRHLDGDAVRAQPPSPIYRLRKFVRKNKGIVAAVSTVLLTAIMGAAVAAQYARDAIMQKERVQKSQGDALLNADLSAIPTLIESMESTIDEIHAPLLARFESGELTDEQKFRAGLLLSRRDAKQAELIVDSVLNGGPSELKAAIPELRRHSQSVVGLIASKLQDRDDRIGLAVGTILSNLDPSHELLQLRMDSLVDEVLALPVDRMSDWLELLSGIHEQLLSKLVVRLSDSDEQQKELRNKIVLISQNLVESNPESVLELSLHVNAEELQNLAYSLDPFASRLVEKLVLDAESPQDDITPDSTQIAQLPAAIVEVFSKHHGRIESNFAFAFTVPIAEFKLLLEEMQRYGYRPVSIRGRKNGDEVRIAAIWNRDGKNFHWAEVSSEEAFRELNDEQRRLNRGLIDLFTLETVPGDIRFMGLWLEDFDFPTEFRFGIHLDDLPRASEEWKLSGLRPVRLHQRDNLDVFDLVLQRDGKDSRLRTNIAVETDPNSFLQLRSNEQPVAIDLSESIRVMEEREKLVKSQLFKAQGQLRVNPNNRTWIYWRAWSNFYLRHYDAAILDLNQLINQYGAKHTEYLTLRARCLGRLRKRELAMQDVSWLRTTDAKPGILALVTATIEANSGDFNAAEATLERTLRDVIPDFVDVYNVSCGYAQLADIAGPESGEKYDELIRLANETLNLAFSCGLSVRNVQSDPDWMSINHRMNAKRLLRSVPRQVYSGIWQADAKYEYSVLRQLSSTAHLAETKKLTALGFVPVSISLADSTFPTNYGGTQHFASIWRRPLPSFEKVEAMTERRANAAVLLSRWGQFESAIHILSPAKRVSERSLFVSRAVKCGVSVENLQAAILNSNDQAIKCMLLLALAKATNQLPDIASWIVQHELESDSSPAVSSAAEFVAQLSRRPNTNSTTSIRPLEHEMILIKAPGTFELGSPNTDPQRDLDEPRLSVSVDYDYALARTEVSQLQFEQFLEEWPSFRNVYQQPLNPDQDGPALRVSWYAAAAYCNWLSRREGIPTEQWCFRPNADGEYAEGMTIMSGYRDRSGFRLPTTAEWEYACRAQSGISTRFFGDHDSVINDYVWYAENSNQHAHGVARKFPNAFGLYDMLGNAWEWCADPYGNFLPIAASSVSNKTPRELRGGSWQTGSRSIRSSERYSAFAGQAAVDFGFRIARTISSSSEKQFSFSDWAYDTRILPELAESQISAEEPESAVDAPKFPPTTDAEKITGDTAAQLSTAHTNLLKSLRTRYAKWARLRLDSEVRETIDRDLRYMYFPVDSIDRYIDALPKEDKRSYNAQKSELQKVFRVRLEELARSNSENQVGLDAWMMLVSYFMSGNHELQLEALNVLLEHHIDNQILYRCITQGSRTRLSNVREKLLRECIERNKYASAAKQQLAEYLFLKSEAYRVAASKDDPVAWMKTIWPGGTDFPKPAAIDPADRESWILEAKSLCEELLSNAGVSTTQRTIQRLLKNMEMQVGRDLSNFEMQDSAGEMLRISDHQGRPVLIFTWDHIWLEWRDLEFEDDRDVERPSMKQVRELVESGKVAVISINTDYAKTEIEFQTDQSQNLFQYWDGQRSKPLRDAFGNSTLILDDQGRIMNRSSAFLNQDQLIALMHASILAENSEEGQDTSFGRK